MPVSTQSQVGDQQQSADALTDFIFTNLRVSMPGIVQSFDPISVTCTVQPAIKCSQPDDAGNEVSASLPLLTDIPVIFPRGGGCTITFPVQEGDECLIIFSDRCNDFWWQSGGIQEPADDRQHDLSDAFIIVGPQSQAKKISNISTNSVQIRTDGGGSFVELTQSGAVNITAPVVTINGSLKVNGSINSTGDQVASGISQTGHTHGGVKSGGDITGKAQ